MKEKLKRKRKGLDGRIEWWVSIAWILWAQTIKPERGPQMELMGLQSMEAKCVQQENLSGQKCTHTFFYDNGWHWWLKFSTMEIKFPLSFPVAKCPGGRKFYLRLSLHHFLCKKIYIIKVYFKNQLNEYSFFCCFCILVWDPEVLRNLSQYFV